MRTVLCLVRGSKSAFPLQDPMVKAYQIKSKVIFNAITYNLSLFVYSRIANDNTVEDRQEMVKFKKGIGVITPPPTCDTYHWSRKK